MNSNNVKENKKNTKKKVMSICAGTMAVAMLAVGSVAYFTDRVSSTGNSTHAGTIDIDLSTVSVDDSKIIEPGCIIPMSYTISNVGTLAADERETITLSVYDNAGTNAVNLTSGAPEFEIYNKDDLEEVDGVGYKAKSGAKPINGDVSTVDGNKIVYKVAQVALDGSDEDIDAATSDKQERDLAILFKSSASNDYQNVTVKLDVVAEAKQHTYTEAMGDDWSSMETETVELSTGANQNVVPVRVTDND